MSEYQYYEWQTIDRSLSSAERAKIEKLSSHIEVRPSQAIVTYNWSSFKHDPKEVLLKYFDAHFYAANWGSLRLMFRFPVGLVAEVDIEPYLSGEWLSFKRHGQYHVLDLEFHPDDGGGWLEIDADLSDFISLRAGILEGDYRLLYLAWLKAMTLYGYPDGDVDEEGDREPPVPPGMKNLSPDLLNFVGICELDPYLVEAAAEASPRRPVPAPIEYGDLVRRLPRAECDDFLTRLAEGEPGIGQILRKRLAGALPPPETPPAAPPRTIQQLVQRAAELENAAAIRQAEAARRQHIARMEALAVHEEQHWIKVEDSLDHDRKIASVYEAVTAQLVELQQLAVFQKTGPVFHQRMQRLAQKYAARPALLQRWKEHGLV